MYKKIVKKRGKVYTYYYHNVREDNRIRNICLGSSLKRAREKLSRIKDERYNLLDNAPEPIRRFEINTGKILTIILVLLLGFGFLYFFSEITGLVVYENSVSLEVNKFISNNSYVVLSINENEYIKSINDLIEIGNGSYYIDSLTVNLGDFNIDLNYGSYNLSISLYDNDTLISFVSKTINIGLFEVEENITNITEFEENISEIENISEEVIEEVNVSVEENISEILEENITEKLNVSVEENVTKEILENITEEEKEEGIYIFVNETGMFIVNKSKEEIIEEENITVVGNVTFEENISNLSLIEAPEIVNEYKVDKNVKRGLNWEEIKVGDKRYIRTYTNGFVTYLENNEYLPIDLDIVSSKEEFDYEVTHNFYKAYFNFNSYKDDLVKTGFDDRYISYKLENINNVNAIIDGNIIRYENIYDNVDLEYEVLPTRLKERLILNNYSENVFSFKVKTKGVDYKENNGVIEFFDKDKILWSLDKPYMYDNNFDGFNEDFISYNVDYDLRGVGNNLFVDLILDKEWLKNANYPVVIDPIVMFYPNKTDGGDAGINDYRSGQNYGASIQVDLGTSSVGSGVKARMLIKWNLTDIPSSAIINDANISIYCGTETGTADVYLYNVSRSWVEGTEDGAPSTGGVNWTSAYNNIAWTTSGGDYAGLLDSETSIASATWAVFTGVVLNSTVQGWIDGTIPNNGIIGKRNVEDDSDNRCNFATDDIGQDYKPRLTIDYTIPGNNPPDDPVLSINSTFGTNLTDQDLHCSFTPTDPDDVETLYANITWLKNNITTVNNYYGLSVTQNALYVNDLNKANLTVNDSWSCQVQICDDSNDCSAWVNSSQLRILINPEVIMNKPNNNSVTSNHFVLLNFTAIDNDGNNMELYVYGANSTILNSTHLLYYREDISNNTELNYNYTSPIVEPNNNVLLLAHFDNLSEYGENYTYFKDFSKSNINLTCGSDGVGDCPSVLNITNAKFGKAYEFDGVNDYIDDTGNAPTILNLTTNLTVSAWVYLNGEQTCTQAALDRSCIIAIHLNQYALLINYTRGVTVGLYENDAWGFIRSPGSLNIGEWYHLALTYNGSDAKIYINGIENKSVTGGGYLNSSNQKFSISGSNAANTNFNGTIDELVIYNKALNSTEILDLYRLKSGTYYWKVNVTDGNLWNSSDMWQFIISDAPNNPNPIINSTLGTNKSNENLHCSFVPDDPENDGVTCDVIWLNNNVTNLTFNDLACSDNVFFMNTLNSSNTTKSEYWSCQVKVEDINGFNSSWVNSSQLNISNSVPKLGSPSDGGSSSTNPTQNDSSVTFTGTGIDDDNDQYTILVCPTDNTLNGACVGEVEYSCESSLTNSGTQADCSISGGGFGGDNYVWYMFVCDSEDECSSPGAQGSGESGSPFAINRPPSVEYANITEINPTTLTNLSCQNGTISDEDSGDTVNLTYDWYKNNESQGIDSQNLSNGNTTKGEAWRCSITPVDIHNYAGGIKNSSEVLIVNSNPDDITVYINSTDGTNLTNQSLNVWFTPTDNDTETNMYYDIIWMKNNVSNFTLTGISATQDVLSVNVLNETNTTAGETWRAQVRINDTTNFSAWINSSELLILNTAPDNPLPIINSTFGSNLTSEDLHCSFTPTDNDTSETLYANITWLKNNITNFTLSSISVTQDSLYVSDLESENTSLGQNWSCQVQICDDSNDCSAWVNSTELRILNTAPNIPSPLINSTDGSNTTAVNLNVYFIPSDNDSNVDNCDVIWLNNNITNLTFNDIDCSNGTLFVNILESNNLSAGENWSAQVKVEDSNGANSSWVNTTQLLILEANVAPDNPSPYINSTFGFNLTSEDLHCSFTPTDSNSGETLYANVSWLKDNVTTVNNYYGLSVTQDVLYVNTLNKNNLTVNSSWSCQVQVCDDSSACSSWVNSSQLRILQNYTLDNCTNIDYPGNYELIADIENSNAKYCMNITVSNVELDCNGYLIDGKDTASTYGVFSDGASGAANILVNNTVKNCRIEDWYRGVYFEYTNESVIDNVNASSNADGIGLWVSDNNIIRNVNSSLNIQNGLWLSRDSNLNIVENNTFSGHTGANDAGISLSPDLGTPSSNEIRNNTIYNNYFGITFEGDVGGSTISNNFSRNTIVNNSVGIYIGWDKVDNNFFWDNFFNNTNNTKIVAGTDNYWNKTKTSGTNIITGSFIAGNYWGNTSGTDFSETCINYDNDGICDNFYNLTDNEIDYLPLTYNSDSIPNNATPLINSTGGLNTTATDLNVWFTPDDPDGDTLECDIIWLNNNVTNLTFNDISCSEDVLFVNVLNNSNLTVGDNWSAQVRVRDSNEYNSSWVNSSQLLILAANVAPNDPTGVIINSTNTAHTNYTTEDLAMNFLCDDPDTSDVLTYHLSVYRNYVLNFTLEDSCNDPEYKRVIIESENTTKYDNWSFSVNVSDDDGLFSATISSVINLTIKNSPPAQITLNEPESGNITTDRTPTLKWNEGSDDDNDNLVYDIFVECEPVCSIDDRIITGDSGNCVGSVCSYTIASDLMYFWDDNDYYNWSVRAYDNDDYGLNSTKWNISIQSEVTLSLPNSTIAFGSKGIGEKDNTTDGQPGPFLIQNDGNCVVDVNISALSWLWDTKQTASSFFQYKVDNYSVESKSFNWSNSQTSWSNVPNVNASFIRWLNNTDTDDTAEVDILIEVPLNEPPGDKESQLSFTGYYVKIT